MASITASSSEGSEVLVTAMGGGKSQHQEVIMDRLKDSIQQSSTLLSSLHQLQSYYGLAVDLSQPQHEMVVSNSLKTLDTIRNAVTSLMYNVQTIEIVLSHAKSFGFTLLPVVTTAAAAAAAAATTDVATTTATTTTTVASGDDSCDQSASNASLNNLPVPLDLDLTNNIMSDLEMEEMALGTPPAKKPTLDPGKVSVNIMECTSCKRKFATQLNSDADTPICKHCRLCLQATSSSVDAANDDDSFDDAPKEDTNTPTTTTMATTQYLEVAASSSSSSSSSNSVVNITMFPAPPTATVVSSDTQTSSSKSDRRVTMPPASCKLCGSKFRYRMCLVRHLKTSHKDVIDLNNLHSYISYDSDDSIPKVFKTSFSEGEDIVEANFSITSERVNSISGMDPDNDSLKDGAADTSLASIDTSYDLTSGLDFDPQKTSSMIIVDDSLKRRFVCHLCNKSFDRQYRLKRHLQVHNPNRPKIKCDLCSKSFTRQDSLEAHVKAAHSKLRPYMCTYEGCNKAYSNSSQLLQHSRLHTGGKPYQCNFCDKSFAFANEHKEHIRDVHTNSNSHKCSYCHKVYSSEEELSLHKTKEHRVECEVCNKTFSRLAYLEVHVKVHEGDGKFNCSSCFKSFDNESNYRQHIKSHPDYKPYGCHVCDISFSHPSNLINHQKAMHGYDPANDSSGSNAQDPVDLTGINLSQNCNIVQEDGTGNNNMCLP